jgi:hypothetical protein
MLNIVFGFGVLDTATLDAGGTQCLLRLTGRTKAFERIRRRWQPSALGWLDGAVGLRRASVAAAAEPW